MALAGTTAKIGRDPTGYPVALQFGQGTIRLNGQPNCNIGTLGAASVVTSSAGCICRVAPCLAVPGALARSGLGDFHHPAPLGKGLAPSAYPQIGTQIRGIGIG